MSYISSRSDHVKTREWDLHSSAGVIPEGAALVLVLENGLAKVKLSSGVSGEQFLGFAMNERTAPLVSRDVFVARVPETAPYTITLPRDVIGTVGVRLTEDNSAVAAGTPGTTTKTYSIAGRTMTFHADQAGDEVGVTYGFAPSYLETIGRGDSSPSNVASAITQVTGTTGAIMEGRVYTDQFDPAVNWAGWTPGTAVTTAANGQVTLGGNGAAIPHARIVAIPEAGNGFLGVEFAN